MKRHGQPLVAVRRGPLVAVRRGVLVVVRQNTLRSRRHVSAGALARWAPVFFPHHDVLLGCALYFLTPHDVMRGCALYFLIPHRSFEISNRPWLQGSCAHSLDLEPHTLARGPVRTCSAACSETDPGLVSAARTNNRVRLRL